MKFSSVSGEASLVSQHASGVMAADAKLVTAQGSASLDMKNESAKAKGSMALTDLQMTHQMGVLIVKLVLYLQKVHLISLQLD